MTQTASNKKIALFTGKFDSKFKEETTKVSNLINDFHLRSPRGSYFLSENSKTILINKYYFLGGGTNCDLLQFVFYFQKHIN